MQKKLISIWIKKLTNNQSSVEPVLMKDPNNTSRRMGMYDA